MVVTQEVHRYGHHLQRALERTDGRVRLEDLQGLVDSGRLVVFANDRAAIGAEPFRLPGGRWGITISLAGGELDAALDLYDECEEEARKSGASEVRVVGRDGWLRTLKARGFKHMATLLTKDLT